MRYILSLLLMVLAATAAIAGFRDTFEKEFLMEPWAGEHLEINVCIDCHASDTMKSKLRSIPDEWKMSWHAQNDVSCHDCHGGDPNDAAMSMSRERGFVGSPTYTRVPDFCGKCHIGILKHFVESGHGKALKSPRRGPNCITCHGSHDVQKASIDIINEQRCTKCHSFRRAMMMKQALFLTEKKIEELDKNLRALKAAGVFIGNEEQSLFNIRAQFHTLFHTIDAALVKERTDTFIGKLGPIEETINSLFEELRFRKMFSSFLVLVFLGLAVVVFLLSKTYKA